MRFGLSLSISGVVLLGFSWAAKLRGARENVCVCVLCTNLFRCMWVWGDWAHYACSSLQSDLLVLIGKDSSNKHRGVVVTQAWHECRAAGSAGCSSQFQPTLFPPNPALPVSPPPRTPPSPCWLSPAPRPGPAEWPQSGLFVWTRPLAVSGLQKCEQDKAVDRGADRNMAVWDT